MQSPRPAEGDAGIKFDMKHVFLDAIPGHVAAR